MVFANYYNITKRGFHHMKKKIATIAGIIIAIAISPAFAFAEGQSADTTTAATIAANTQGAVQTNSTAASTATLAAGITPDSPLYAFDKLMESIQVTLTFSAGSKAELLVSFANERLAEASILSEQSKAKLVEKIMKAYIQIIEKAEEKINEAAESGKEVKFAIEEIKVSQDTAGKVILSLKGVLPQESAEELKTKIAGTVKKTLAAEAFVAVKKSFFDAKQNFQEAKGDWQAAKKSGDTARIKAAEEKLAQAEKYKDEMENVKNLVEIKKESMIKAVEEEAKKVEETAKATAKAREALEKEAKKQAEKVEKVKEKAEKEPEKLAEKARKQAEKLKEKVEKEAEKAREKAEKDDQDKDDKDEDDDDKEDED
jgi:Domain of unknown function (DUF5667)